MLANFKTYYKTIFKKSKTKNELVPDKWIKRKNSDRDNIIRVSTVSY